MERLPHQIQIPRTPEEQARQLAEDEPIRAAHRGEALPDSPEDRARRDAGPPDWPAKALVAALRAERLRQGLSLADVADRMGSDRSGLHKLEIGLNRNPTLETLTRYAEALGVRIDWQLRQPA